MPKESCSPFRLCCQLAIAAFVSCDALAAEKLHPVDRQLSIATIAADQQKTDTDRVRLQLGPLGGLQETTSRSETICRESTARMSSLIEADVARLTLSTDLRAIDGLSDIGNLSATAEGHILLSIERATRKILSFERQSIGALTGSMSLSSLETDRELWSLDLTSIQNQSSALAVQIAPGDYRLSLTASQSGVTDVSSDLRLSLVNRGDINGNDQFDAADEAVVTAIVNESAYAKIADLDDDGDNDEIDRRLWLDGLGPTSTPASIQPLFTTPVSTLSPAVDASVSATEVLTCSSSVSSSGDPSTQLIPGDVNGDGTVEFQDFLIMARNFGQQGGLDSGDFDGDGEVGFADFLVLSAHYNDAFAAQSDAAIPPALVPEPQRSVWPIVLLLIALCRRRRFLQ